MAIIKANIKVALDSRDLVKEIMAVHTFKCKPFVLIVPPWCYPRLRSILQKTIKSLNSFIKSSVIGICTCLVFVLVWIWFNIRTRMSLRFFAFGCTMRREQHHSISLCLRTFSTAQCHFQRIHLFTLPVALGSGTVHILVFGQSVSHSHSRIDGCLSFLFSLANSTECFFKLLNDLFKLQVASLLSYSIISPIHHFGKFCSG